MNVEEMLLLADYMEAVPPEQFDMQHWCGTACCVAGHYATGLRQQEFIARKHQPELALLSIPEFAAAKLGLSRAQRNELFLGLGLTTPAGAATLIRRMVARDLAPVVLSCMPGLASAGRRRERAGAGAPPA